MFSHNDLRKGTQIIFQGQPWEVLEYNLNFQGRGSSKMQAKIKNLITGNVVSKTFHPSDSFREAELKKVNLKFIYSHKGKYVFQKDSRRTELQENILGVKAKFLKQNQELEGIVFENKIINVLIPIKMQLKVIESPPGIKAGRAEPGTKQVTLETGAVINVPLFIKEGDVVEVNTGTGEYVKRVE